MASRRISPKYSRTERGDLWLAVGLDTRGLDSPWVCFRPPSRRRYVNVIMGVINPARTRLNLARSWGGGAARGPRIATVYNPFACSYLCLSLHTNFVGYSRDFIRHSVSDWSAVRKYIRANKYRDYISLLILSDLKEQYPRSNIQLMENIVFVEKIILTFSWSVEEKLIKTSILKMSFTLLFLRWFILFLILITL